MTGNDSWKDKALHMVDTRIINYSGRTLCDNYRRPLLRCDNEAQALRLYKNCISWALQERYPTKEDLLEFASKDILADNGIYIDREFDGERIDGHICCVFLNCKGNISVGLNIKKAIIPMLYMSEGCDMEVDVEAGLLHPIPVELYYDSRVTSPDIRMLKVKDCNGASAEDNTGFSEKELATEPDMDNVML